MMPSIRRTALDANATPAIASLDTVQALMRRTIDEERYRAALSSAFGGSALVLAAIGLYGLLARRVADQRREIGVRMAVGARPADIVSWVVRDAGRLVLTGLALGIPAAVGAARLLRSQLYGVEPSAPHIFATASIRSSPFAPTRKASGLPRQKLPHRPLGAIANSASPRRGCLPLASIFRRC
jgi:ABC-type antimicrobial peptide transport system permease subunit